LTLKRSFETFATHTEQTTTNMRTKTLLLTAAVLAAGLGASMAQSVFSVNAVGYVNVNLLHGYNLIANPLNGTNNLISTVIPSAPDSSVLYHFDTASQHYFNTDTYFFFGACDPNNGWYDQSFNPSTTVLPPGIGFFLYNPGGSSSLTFVGDVPQGNLTNNIAANYGIYSSIVPQAGTLTSLGFPAQDSMVYYSYNAGAQHYNQSLTYFFFGAGDPNNGWYDQSFNPADPTPSVAEGFLLRNPGSAVAWGRTFSVN